MPPKYRRAIVLLSGDNFLKILISVNFLFFLISLFISGTGVKLNINPMVFLSPTGGVLFALGGAGTYAAEMGKWWTLLSAGYLHGSLLHIIFNMLALLQLGRLVISGFGESRMFVIFTVATIAGFGASVWAGIGLTIGASAGVCGLIGAAFVYGKRTPTPFGAFVSQHIIGWIVSLVLLGIAIPGINNWGHGGGFVAGILLALVMKDRPSKTENFVWQVLAIGSGILTVVCLGLNLVLMI